MKKNTYIKAKLAKKYQNGGSIYTQNQGKPTTSDKWTDLGMGALDTAVGATPLGVPLQAVTGKNASDLFGYEYKTETGKTFDTGADMYASMMGIAAPIAANAAGVPTPVAMAGQQAGKEAVNQVQTNFMMKQGGAVPQTTINVERNELEVSNGKIIKDFKKKPKHPEDPSMMDPNGNINAGEGNIIIPANLREKYLKGDKLTRQSIEANVTNQQAKREQAEQQAIDLLSQGAATQEFDMFGNGGKIKINKKYKSTFDDLASSANMSTEDYINSLTMKVKYANGGKIYNPNLAKSDKDFQKWYNENTLEGKRGVPFDLKNLDYDYYSYYKNTPKFELSTPDKHFPDTYKLPSHETFSNESNYSGNGSKGYWIGETFIKTSNKVPQIYANGGPVKVTDPNDPRLKSYQDSLKLFNYTVDQYGRHPVGPLGEKLDLLSAHPGIYDKDPIKPLAVTNVPGASGTAQFPIYKKPVQEVIYEKPFAKAAAVSKIATSPNTVSNVPDTVSNIPKGPVYRQVEERNKPVYLSGAPQYRTDPKTGKSVPVYKDQYGRETLDSTYKKSMRIPDSELRRDIATDIKKYNKGGGVTGSPRIEPQFEFDNTGTNSNNIYGGMFNGPETFDYNAFLSSQQPSQRTYGDPMQEYLADKAAAESRGAAQLRADTPAGTSPNYMDYANKIIPHLGNMYQFGQTFGKKDYVPLATNPEYGNVKSLMRNRQIDMRPIIEDINVQSRVARNNARIAGNVGGYLSNSAQIGANTQRALANARMQEQMANNQMRAEEAQSLMGLGSEAARYQNMYDTGRVMTDANARNIRAAALQNTSGIYQGQSRDVKMDQNDQLKFKALKDMFPYFTYDDYYNLKQRNQQ